jgi:hypothetical protein
MKTAKAEAEDTSRYYYIAREKMTCVILLRINFKNFKIFLIITRVKFLLGVEF